MRKRINRNVLLSIYKKLYKFYSSQKWWPADTRFEVIVGAILTQNTSWKNVEKAIKNLKKANVLSSPYRIGRLKKGELSRLIKPAGYYNVKAERLKNFLTFLTAEYSGSLNKLSHQKTEKLRQELLGVNGIGPETCDSILLYAFKRPVFVVDAYTKRIFERHKICNKDLDYHQIQKIFMDNLPRNYKLYNEYHALIVRLGKEVCRKLPNCKICPLGKRKVLANRIL